MMRRRTRAGARVLAVVVAAALLAGCQGDRTDAVGHGDDLPDCSADECAAQVSELNAAVADLPGVTSADLDYEPEQITDSAAVTGEIEVERGTTCAGIEDDLGRLLWQSPVSPVASIRLRCYLPGASGPDYEHAAYSFSLLDGAEVTERWGPRGG